METISLNLTLAKQLVELSPEQLNNWCETDTIDSSQRKLPQREIHRRKQWLCAMVYWKLGSGTNVESGEKTNATIIETESKLISWLDNIIDGSINRKQRLGIIK